MELIVKFSLSRLPLGSIGRETPLRRYPPPRTGREYPRNGPRPSSELLRSSATALFCYGRVLDSLGYWEKVQVVSSFEHLALTNHCGSVLFGGHLGETDPAGNIRRRHIVFLRRFLELWLW